MATEAMRPFPVPSTPAGEAGRVGAKLKVNGVIVGNADMQIDGEVEGTISLPGNKLTIGPSGQIKSNLDVLDLVVYGRVEGKIQASGLVAIKKDSTVLGDIRAARVSIEDGAHFEGYIETQRQNPAG
jgi:cytoskeletal protein CcmA (bactofilin family)